MKVILFPIFALVTAAWAQTPPPLPSAQPSLSLPQLPDDEVIATFDDGAKFTMGDFRKIYTVLPPDMQQSALRDRRTFLHQWAFMRKLAKMAAEQKLDQQSPHKEALDYYRMMILSQAKISDAVMNTTVEPAEIEKYYNENKEKYKQVRVKTIYISFSTNPTPSAGGKKPLSEEAAKAKASKVLADLRTGADFIKAVKEYSEDETSRAKNGDFQTLRPSDNIPDSIKTAVFALKPGELTDLIRQPSGFYIFRAEEVSSQPLAEVRGEIFAFLKQKRYTDWMAQANRDTKVIYNSPAFLGTTPPTAK